MRTCADAMNLFSDPSIPKCKPTITTNGVTSIAGVFSEGDCVNGGKEVVDAVRTGKGGVIK